MPTNTHVDELKINELTEAQYDAAVANGTIGANEISVLTDASDVGTVNRVCDIVYTKKIASSGNTINVPTTGGTMALTSDIPTIATSVDATSTDNETVSAKLFYDTIGDIETLINAL